MDKPRPINLNSLTFSDKSGKMVVIEDYNLTFAKASDAEKHIQKRYKYWTDLLKIDLVIAPNLNETLEHIEIKKVFKLTAKHLKLDYSDVMSKSRKPVLVEARRLAMNICLERGVKKARITDAVGITHDIIIHHQNKWAGFMEIDPDYAFNYGVIEEYVLKNLSNETI